MKHQFIKRFLSGLLSFSLVLPSIAFAQGFSGYGQALGNRTQQNRRVTVPSSIEGSTFYRRGQEQPLDDFSLQQQMPQQSTPEGIQGLGYQIHILGQVHTPGTFRLPPSTRLDEALNRSDGIKELGSKRRVELRRGGAVHRYDLLKFQNHGDLSQNPFLLDNDVIFVNFAEKNTEIRGSVKNGDIYELTENERTVWDLIQLAGGYTTGVSYNAPVTLIRFVDGEKQLIEVENVQEALSRKELFNGDIVVVPHILTDGRRFDYNVSTLPADNLFFPTFNYNVYVMGAVELPGGYEFNPHYSIREFVGLSGPTKFAKMNFIYVVTADGKRIRHPVKSGYRVSPGDTIIVPEKSWTTPNVLQWYNTLANSVIVGFTLKKLITE